MLRIAPFVAALAACLGAMTGCAGPELVPSPNLYVLDPASAPFDDVPPELRTSRVELVYATDRLPDSHPGEPLRYGSDRSQSLAMGLCSVDLGPEGTDWETLVRDSVTHERSRTYPLRLAGYREHLRFPASNAPVAPGGGSARFESPSYVEARSASERMARELIRERLAHAARKEVLVFVHGYNNTIEDAAFRLAQLWHFMGRTGVPVIYSWPAGYASLLQGYSRDRESGEFTIFHLKQFIRTVASIPEVERINFLAHSRGTDVLTTALRELLLEHGGSPLETRSELKLGRVVLAAADLDWEVSQQRIGAERVRFAAEQTVIYLSHSDKAIGFSDWLFASAQRIGSLMVTDLSRAQQQTLLNDPDQQVIDARVDAGFLGHGYFISNPAVLSDLILVLRDGRAPGAEHGRPLERPATGFWVIQNGYPGPLSERPPLEGF